ncbi:acyltransferase [Ancylobacter sp. WKF20]|uniref:acyltransferase family protein n=1 Tax=Ancylobacter sp. WKF20 TaxID=3039801 RepID=UPI0024341101|nr:acyltransferase [Ancylobacter sp. WKF20]WGD28930.1 acyltransferase [Ancylobacter sp. WKF20]
MKSRDLPMPSKQLLSVQCLRALAAIMVTIAHGFEEAISVFHLALPISLVALGKGVDIFFVISGFIIYYSSVSRGQYLLGVRRFAYLRIVRVVPLYYIFTTIYLFTAIISPKTLNKGVNGVAHIISSYLFVPYPNPEGALAPLLALGWTLNYEMQFYLLFGILLVAVPPRYLGASVIGALVSVSVIGQIIDPDPTSPLHFITNSIIIEFGMGVALAMVYQRVGKSFANVGMALGCFAVGIGLLLWLNTPPLPFDLSRFITAGLPALLIVGAGVLLWPADREERLPGILVELGNSSYSLYLSHRFVQRPLQIAFTHFLPSASWVGWAYAGCAVIAAISAGHVVYLLLERPLLRWFRRSDRASRAGR